MVQSCCLTLLLTFPTTTDIYQELALRNSLVIQWLGFCAFTAEGLLSDLSWGTKIPQAAEPEKELAPHKTDPCAFHVSSW